MGMKKSLLAACVLSGAAAAHADVKAAPGYCNTTYEVTITNLTLAQVLSPPLVVSHAPGVHLYAVGEPASEGLEALAEGGDTSVLTAALLDDPAVCAAETGADVVPPGHSLRVLVKGSRQSVFSFATMLVNTNDAFAAADGVAAPLARQAVTRMVPAYDAGSELNDESCAHVPGPACGGAGTGADDGEGFVHVHRGIHNVGDLAADEYDWRNPAARVEIRRVR